ncbi:MAG: 30S ribosomal protein S6 [Alphaproteobacteria bacterium]
MPLYESTFIARHDMSTQQVEGLAETFSTIITDNGGNVTKTESWGLKTLAYRVKKNRKGHFIFFNIDAPPSALQEYERNLRLDEDILRYLTVRVDELDPEPSIMMQARASRDDRGHGRGPRDDRPRDGGEKPADKEAKTADAAKSADAEAKPAESSAAQAPTPAKGDDS